MPAARRGGPRVGVVGAGPAGLSAAWFLAERGYTNVTVLEARDRVGGKCHSFTHNGRPVDLGAFTLTFAYREAIRIAKQVGVRLVSQPPRLATNWDIKPVQVLPILTMVRREYSLLAIGAASVRYLLALWKYRKVLDRPGFAGMSARGPFPELSLPFAEWTAKGGMSPLVDVFRLAVTDMGYGHILQMPTAYVLKYMGFLNTLTIGLFLIGLGFGWPRRVSVGFERLWEALSWRLNVRTGAEITRVERAADRVTVTWTERSSGMTRTQEFDRLIVSAQPKALGTVIAWSEDEAACWAKVTTNDYWVTVYESEGMPNQTVDAMHGVGRKRAGCPWEIMRPWPDSNAAVFYTFGEFGVTRDQIDERIRTDVQALYPQARLGAILQQVCWSDYFPHVNEAEMAAGFYDDLEALQGQRLTYFAGALPAFETVANTTDYSRSLVERFFPPV